ncbi:MAG: HPr family phosphocarrier protein [Elusimicrobiota bacterium]|jgi:phosphocarrier protein|nr:HPr family phosphocarrier protein [Elusimicrobiota bacterium]
MIKEKIVIQNKLGLHARPASLFVQTTSKFKSDVFVEKGTQKVNGKSILGIMMLAAGIETELDITVNGEDEKEAFESIKKLIDDKFYED